MSRFAIAPEEKMLVGKPQVKGKVFQKGMDQLDKLLNANKNINWSPGTRNKLVEDAMKLPRDSINTIERNVTVLFRRKLRERHKQKVMSAKIRPAKTVKETVERGAGGHRHSKTVSQN
jgi:hypothetical protein